MPKTTMSEEVQVLRFFETGPIEKVEVLFNIVCEKMRERLQKRESVSATHQTMSSSRKRQRHGTDDTPSRQDPETNERADTGASS